MLTFFHLATGSPLPNSTPGTTSKVTSIIPSGSPSGDAYSSTSKIETTMQQSYFISASTRPAETSVPDSKKVLLSSTQIFLLVGIGGAFVIVLLLCILAMVVCILQQQRLRKRKAEGQISNTVQYN